MSLGGKQLVSGDDFRDLSNVYRNKGVEVVDLTRFLTDKIGNAYWQSAAADNFRSDWNSNYAPTLKKLGDVLDQLSKELQQRAQVADELNRR